jgi:hypothetical protein
MPTNPHEPQERRNTITNMPEPSVRDAEHPGYETTDVNVGGVVVFLAGLGGFLVVFFVFCFVMGKVINGAFLKEDGPIDKWHEAQGKIAPPNAGGRRENLASNSVMQQRELQKLTDAFPTPRLEVDDSNQSLADLHAREDLLLENYSTDANGTVRIPIERAMELIAQRGLPVHQENAGGGPKMAGDQEVVITPPLTSGFARTGYELDVMEARAQKLSYGKAEAGTQTQIKPTHGANE